MHWQGKSAQFEKSASIPAPSTFINRQRDRIHPGRASSILLQNLKVAPKQVEVDLGFRGKEVDLANPELEIIHRGRIKTMTQMQRRWLKRRQAVEPAIGHLKSDNRMQRCWLQGATGDASHALCCAVGYNLRWLMRAVERLGLKGLLLCLLWLEQWARFAAALLTQDTTFTGSPSMRTGFASAPRFNLSK